ncbi:MAG: sigma-54-dependent Fis family transcriptional regulator, partial [Calditrichia bacterium]|nr:sigma-54-dependent Fis family transcriptional regulator [Calditrichia bacterium]
HEKGAFTGANQQRTGRFEEANGGTLFIDEVGDIPLNIQIKLLRVIQFGQFEKLGSSVSQTTDVRIIAATHQNLEELIKNKQFREDLYYRLNVVTIPIPSLKKRKLDILPLVDAFVNKYKRENIKEIKGFSKEARDTLIKYDFPGNVRELENIVERAVILCRTDYITNEDLPFQLQVSGINNEPILNPYNLNNGHAEKMNAFETEMIKEALNQAENNQSAAARLLQITERHLRSRLEKLNLKRIK